MPAFSSAATSLSAPLPPQVKGKLRRTRNPRARQAIHLRGLQAFFRDEGHFRTLHSVLSGTGGAKAPSLRMLEFLCTTYARAHSGLTLQHPADGTGFNLQAVYQDILTSQGKSMFDPFRRTAGNDEIQLRHASSGLSVTTNVAQLRFFKFAITHGVIDYARAHALDIDDFMRRHWARARVERRRKTESEERASAERAKRQRSATPAPTAATEGESPKEEPLLPPPPSKRRKVAPQQVAAGSEGASGAAKDTIKIYF